MIYLQLFYEFFKVGLFSIGGGMATVPFLLDLSVRTLWFTQEELTNMIAISESTPGPIGINMATYAGYETSGILGGIIATLGLITPSIIIITIISLFLTKFLKYKYIQTVLRVLRAAVIGLISYSLFRVLKLCLFNNTDFSIISTVLFIIFSAISIICKKIHPIYIIALGALTGIILL